MGKICGESAKKQKTKSPSVLGSAARVRKKCACQPNGPTTTTDGQKSYLCKCYKDRDIVSNTFQTSYFKLPTCSYYLSKLQRSEPQSSPSFNPEIKYNQKIINKKII